MSGGGQPGPSTISAVAERVHVRLTFTAIEKEAAGTVAEIARSGGRRRAV